MTGSNATLNPSTQLRLSQKFHVSPLKSEKNLDLGGQPVYRLGTHLTDDSSPFKERWGWPICDGDSRSATTDGKLYVQHVELFAKLNVDSDAVAGTCRLASEFIARGLLDSKGRG